MIERTPNVPSLPEAASRAGRLANDPDSSTDELAEALAGDPALCSHLLKVANSAYYGARTTISSIKQATVLLGRRTLRSVAVAASIQAVFPKRDVHASFSPRALWTHSIRMAGACSELSRLLGVGDPEDAFVAGLIHDLGLLVELQHHDTFALVVDDTVRMPATSRRLCFPRFERKRFGADHQDIGALLFESWGFPEILVLAAKHHHEPMVLDGAAHRLATLVNLAESIGIAGEHGLPGEPHEVPVDPRVLVALNMDAEQFSAHAPSVRKAAVEVDLAFRYEGTAAA